MSHLRQELACWRRDATLTPAERDRVETAALSAAGWSIAPHPGYPPGNGAAVVSRLRRDDG